MALTRKRKSTRISNNTTSTPSDPPRDVDAATTMTTSRNVKKKKSLAKDTTSNNAKKRKTAADSTSKSAKKQETKKDVVIEPSEQHPASIFRTTDNSQATFLGLPAELRLQIYAYLCDSSIIHVHKRNETHDRQGGPMTPFTWTPCRAPNLRNPLLCANPKWSGMCDEEDRCTYKFDAPPEPIGFWALAASNKFIRNETQEFFIRRTVVSIHPQNLMSWLCHLKHHAPQQIEHLRRITLAGPNTWRSFTTIHLSSLREEIPNLEAVGIQCQDAVWRWPRSYLSSDVPPRDEDKDAWRRWNVVEWIQEVFELSITIAIEAMVWQQSHQSHEFLEQLIAIRILREAKPSAEGEGKGGWDDDNVKIEIDRSGKLAPQAAIRTANWRAWWRGKEMKSLTWSLN